MDKRVLLIKLEALFGMKEVKNGFPTQQACLEWSSKVAPLLKFNEQYYTNFVEHAHKMNLPLSSFTLEPAFNIMVSQIQMAIEELKIEIEAGQKESSTGSNSDSYIDEDRIRELKSLPKKIFDLTKLVRILEELNSCHQTECHMATIMLVRALMDHVPPIFGCNTFKEVASSYGGSSSFKESMEHLENSSRKIADRHLHCRIRKSEASPNKTQVNFRNHIDVLLEEIARILK